MIDHRECSCNSLSNSLQQEQTEGDVLELVEGGSADVGDVAATPELAVKQDSKLAGMG